MLPVLDVQPMSECYLSHLTTFPTKGRAVLLRPWCSADVKRYVSYLATFPRKEGGCVTGPRCSADIERYLSYLTTFAKKGRAVVFAVLGVRLISNPTSSRSRLVSK